MMKNKYRVDRADSMRVPCGMNSIRYVGNSFATARNIFANLKAGLDSWDKQDDSYGVILSEWDSRKNDYTILFHKDISLKSLALS